MDPQVRLGPKAQQGLQDQPALPALQALPDKMEVLVNQEVMGRQVSLDKVVLPEHQEQQGHLVFLVLLALLDL